MATAVPSPSLNNLPNGDIPKVELTSTGILTITLGEVAKSWKIKNNSKPLEENQINILVGLFNEIQGNLAFLVQKPFVKATITLEDQVANITAYEEGNEEEESKYAYENKKVPLSSVTFKSIQDVFNKKIFLTPNSSSIINDSTYPISSPTQTSSSKALDLEFEPVDPIPSYPIRGVTLKEWTTLLELVAKEENKDLQVVTKNTYLTLISDETKADNKLSINEIKEVSKKIIAQAIQNPNISAEDFKKSVNAINLSIKTLKNRDFKNLKLVEQIKIIAITIFKVLLFSLTLGLAYMLYRLIVSPYYLSDDKAQALKKYTQELERLKPPQKEFDNYINSLNGIGVLDPYPTIPRIQEISDEEGLKLLQNKYTEEFNKHQEALENKSITETNFLHQFETDAKRFGVNFVRVDGEINDKNAISIRDSEKAAEVLWKPLQELLKTEKDKSWRIPLQILNSQTVLNQFRAPFTIPFQWEIDGNAYTLQIRMVDPYYGANFPPVIMTILRDEQGDISSINVSVTCSQVITQEYTNSPFNTMPYYFGREVQVLKKISNEIITFALTLDENGSPKVSSYESTYTPYI